jgi:hypothetical protein
LGASLDAAQIKEGLFALPTSQQLSHLFSSAANIVDAHDLLAVADIYYWIGRDKKYLGITPAVLYGISHDFSIFLNIPFAAQNTIDRTYSAGIQDIFVQAEYAYFHKETQTTSLVGTVVGTLYLPTGSSDKNPPTGFGSPGVLLGTTMSYTNVDWYWFISPFVLLNTTHHKTKFGNQFLYQAGVGANILSKPDSFIFALIMGFFGINYQRDIIKGCVNVNSGGNVCYVGPSVWLSTQRFVCQTGVVVKVAEHLHGKQNKNKYIFGVDLRWKFND